MVLVQQMSDKKMMLDALRVVLSGKIEKVVLSVRPPQTEKKLLRYTQPWLRLTIPLAGSYCPGYYNGGLEHVNLQKGSILITQPEGVLTESSEELTEMAQIVFRDDYIRYLYYPGGGRMFWRHSCNPPRSWARHIVNSLSEIPAEPSFDSPGKNLVKALIQAAMIELEEDKEQPRGKAYNTFSSALEFMRENSHDNINRSSVAKACGITPSHLSRLCKRFSTEDFKDILKQMRLKNAERLLHNKALTIEEIAYLSGFKASAHFIRVFTKYNGCSPGRYRWK